MLHLSFLLVVVWFQKEKETSWAYSAKLHFLIIIRRWKVLLLPHDKSLSIVQNGGGFEPGQNIAGLYVIGCLCTKLINNCMCLLSLSGKMNY